MNLIGNTKGPPRGPLLWTAGPGLPDGGVRPWVGEAGPEGAQRIPRQPAGPGRATLGPGLHQTPWARGTYHRKVVAIDHQWPSSSEVDVFLPPVAHLSGASKRDQGLNRLPGMGAPRVGGGRIYSISLSRGHVSPSETTCKTVGVGTWLYSSQDSATGYITFIS